MSKKAHKRNTANKTAAAVTIDTSADKFDRSAVIQWHYDASNRLSAYASKLWDDERYTESLEAQEHADNAVLWAKWLKTCPSAEFNARCIELQGLGY